MSLSRLYIIDGVSSIWKQDLVQYVDHIVPNAAVVRKFSTRNFRAGEDLNLLDLEFVSPQSFAQIAPDYAYEYAGELYGIQKTRLKAALAAYRHVFVIVRNSGIIRILRSEFARHGPISVFIHMDVQLASNRGLAAKNALLRAAVKEAFEDYLREPECYDEVVVNGGSKNDFFRLVSLLIKRGSGAVLVLRSADERRQPIVVVSTRRTRRVIQTVLAVVSTLTVGFMVNMITRGSGSYWEIVSFVLGACLLVMSLLLQVVLNSLWRECS